MTANIFGTASSVWIEGRRTNVRTEETNLGSLTRRTQTWRVAQVVRSSRSWCRTRTVAASATEIGHDRPGHRHDSARTAANPLAGKNAGEISQLDIENSLRFNNGLTLITLTRAQLKDVLEHAVAGSGDGNTPGQFGQFAGISMCVDLSRPAGDRVRFACLTKSGVKDAVVVSNGIVLGSDSVRIVTLDFLAGGGDSYPFADYVSKNPGFARRIDLEDQMLGAGKSTFAAAGSEQDAFAEFMLDNYASTPYAIKDVAVGEDQRIQQAGTRPDLRATTVGATQAFSVRNAKAGSVVIFSIGAQSAANQFDLGALGCVSTGVDELLFLPLGTTDAAGNATYMFPRTSASGVLQALILEQLLPTLEIRTTHTVAF